MASAGLLFFFTNGFDGLGMKCQKLKVAILGSGNIGTDLLIKILRSPFLECTLFMGRNMASPGMTRASNLGVRTSSRGVQAILSDPDFADLVFDATSAIDHLYHGPLLQQLGKVVIDLTPARVGDMCVPALNLNEALNRQDINMVTCGGQAAIPLAHVVARVHGEVEYIEVVSSIASRSAGPATRISIDEYVETTEAALQMFAGCDRSKAILILNPADPCIDMQTTVFAKVCTPNIPELHSKIAEMVKTIQAYVPGYQLVLPPMVENGRVVVMVKVRGLGDYLPRYAGNLDIINCAALRIAEEYARRRLSGNVPV